MTHIKKIVIQGFKSFARKTEIPLENSMNVIVGPNGSGKSNITDALCFVLGRLSIKSIRATKAANLLFSGNKIYRGASEASVELVFDNSDKSFSLPEQEITIKRIVRTNGQSIYKINNQTKTRQELLELLSYAGIDPNGFNIVLQGEIASMIKMSSEDRRKIIEEVAGISIYETRKEKSLRELEKTEEKLKEVSAVLRERKSYLKNLEKERQDALNFQKLEETIKKCKATIIDRTIKDKQKEIWGIERIIESHNKEIDKIKKQVQDKKLEIEQLEYHLSEINKKIQDSTSNEQENLHRDIADLKAELAGLEVRKENFENRIKDSHNKINHLKEKQERLEQEINNIQTTSPKIKQRQEEQKKIQEELNQLEKKRRRFYVLKSELSTLNRQYEEKQKNIIESNKEIEITRKSLDSLEKEIKFAKSINHGENLRLELKKNQADFLEEIKKLKELIIIHQNKNAVLEENIRQEEKLEQEILTLDNCPLCKQDVTEEYKDQIKKTSQEKITSYKIEKENNNNQSNKIKENITTLEEKLSQVIIKINEIDIDIIKLKTIEEKNNLVNKLIQNQNILNEEINILNQNILKYKKEFEQLKDIEEKYDELRLKLQEFNFLDIDVDSQIVIKQRELSRIEVEIKSLTRDIEESNEEFNRIFVLIKEKQKVLDKKQKEEQILFEKCEILFSQKNEISDKQKAFETDIIGFKHLIHNLEEKINSNKIIIAQYNAQLDSLLKEQGEYKGLELFNGNIDEIKERLQKSQFKISQVGNVNLKAVEVFDQVTEQVNSIEERVKIIETEKQKIVEIIEEIDKKKRKSFNSTLDSINELFTRNFNLLSNKGEVSLELEDKKNPFNSGLNILVKVGKSKYFDITSLSGGEKTLVALALIFAIQEYKPYCFYIFDEIDAALDKHNSELLAALIKKYKNTGQYIIITHNDTLISEATTLYGISMQENISKVISLKI